jgi:hypothetical protein
MNIELDEQGRPKYNENGDRILYPRQWIPAPENIATSKLNKYQRKKQLEEKRKALSNTNALITNASSKVDTAVVTTPVKTKKTKSKYSDDIPTPGIDFSPISPGFVATPSIFEQPSTFDKPSIFEQPYFVDPEMESSVPKRLFSEVSDDESLDLLDLDYDEKGGRRKSRKSKKFRKSKKSRKTKKSRKLRRKH